MVVTEALAHGIPVLATRVGGLPEALGRAPGGRRPGILVPPDDAGRPRRGAGAVARRPRPAGAPARGGAGPACLAAHLVRDERRGRPACSPRWRPDGASLVNRVGVGARMSGEQVRPLPTRGGPGRPGGRASTRRGGGGRVRWAARSSSAALVVGLGTGPFLDGAARDRRPRAGGRRRSSPLLTTVCGAWRWRLVARRLGADLTLSGAVASCYRAQFLNATLPGGVLGDVGRGVQHGRGGGDVGRGLRGRRLGAHRRPGGARRARRRRPARRPPVRPAPARRHVGGRGRCSSSSLVPSRSWRRAGRGRGHRAARWLRVVAARPASAACSGPASVGDRAALGRRGGRAPRRLRARRPHGGRAAPRWSSCCRSPCVVLVVSAVPLNLAGWGPREGAAAWVFAAAGLGAATGAGHGRRVRGDRVRRHPARARRCCSPAGCVGGPRAPTRPRCIAAAHRGWMPRRGAPWLTVPTPCSAARSRSTAASTTRPTGAWCCRTRPTSTGSTPCGPAATPSSSAPARCGPTTRAWRCAPPTAGPAGSPQGRAPTPRKVTLTRHPGLDPRAAIFAGGDGDPLVYCATAAVAATRERLGDAATVVDAGAAPQVGRVAEDLGARGVRRLMVEGGRQRARASSSTARRRRRAAARRGARAASATPGAPRFVADVRMPGGGRPRADLAEVRRIEDVVLLRYALSARFEQDEPGGTTR